MQITISLGDLGLFILFVLAVVVGIYLVITLRNVSMVLKQAKKILDENEQPIKELIKPLPKIAKNFEGITGKVSKGVEDVDKKVPCIMKNVDGITDNLNKSTKSINTAVDTIGEGITDTLSIVQGTAGDVTMYIKIINEIAKFMTGVFSKK